jgi:uncharacterized Rossmann fold enzyme
MPLWIPEAVWEGQDVFIIGGGPSLKGFDWSLLKNEFTIGCNAAFLLGEQVSKICYFGDFDFFEKFKKQLESYKGVVFTSANKLLYSKVPYLWTLQRRARGLYTDAIGWNDSTGASAINLALLLGAKRVYLLGFDMNLATNKDSNWHSHYKKKATIGSINSFKRAIESYLVKDLPIKFPGREVVNVSDCSQLKGFPIVSFEAFWKERRNNNVL